MIIALLVILGGMGFPIVFNIFTYLRIKTLKLFNKFYYRENNQETITRILQVNSRLALATTLILIITGFAAYLMLEQNGTLKDHQTITGKLVTSFFGAITPRTAGFNTVDMAKLSLPMIMFYLLLMWIGASPSSTGGGIKTTTIAVAILNLKSIIRNRKCTQVFHTQISEHSINKAFAVILLSLLTIGIAVTLISVYDSDKGLLNIAFESFSAFSTVGLTLGITPQLSDISKVILVFTMFIGRVGALTILMAFVSEARPQAYRYPEEEIQY
jgi:Trk-type K+ transport system membrane component